MRETQKKRIEDLLDTGTEILMLSEGKSKERRLIAMTKARGLALEALSLVQNNDHLVRKNIEELISSLDAEFSKVMR